MVCSIHAYLVLHLVYFIILIVFFCFFFTFLLVRFTFQRYYLNRLFLFLFHVSSCSFYFQRYYLNRLFLFLFYVSSCPFYFLFNVNFLKLFSLTNNFYRHFYKNHFLIMKCILLKIIVCFFTLFSYFFPAH